MTSSMTNISTASKNKRIIFLFWALLFLSFVCFATGGQEEEQQEGAVSQSLLQFMGFSPSPESIDYVQNKTQFQLHTLLTEQRHRATWNLSERIQKDYEAGLSMLFTVDRDISGTLDNLAQDTGPCELAVLAIQEALLSGNRIYIYGCGATGRLAKQMESTFWRPFWAKVKENPKIRKKLEPFLKGSIENRLTGEMTGADRALISSLEGFEDLLLIGRLQLKDHGIQKGDVVICVTEGGETSSVIGAILFALDQWKQADSYDPERSKQKLFFVYNNPDDRLLPFNRSRRVLQEPGITKINLTTGPQGITGSTRMQATTSETFVIGHILQTAVERTLRTWLSKRDMAKLGFKKSISLENKFREFPGILRQIEENISAIARFTEWESQAYENGRFSTYFAQKGLITVFIDSTERSPTFRLYPLDTIKEKERKCWIQVWTPAKDPGDAWEVFLGRPFKGLTAGFYKRPFEEEIDDPYLRKSALNSLKNAGNDQQFLYDFSFSVFNQTKRGPAEGDLGVAVLIDPESGALLDETTDFSKFIQLFLTQKARVVILWISNTTEKKTQKFVRKIPLIPGNPDIHLISISLPVENDPMCVNHQVALKMILNAHSTAVMARQGKVIGNTMTNVSPSNLKLIGRATYLIQSHVNDALAQPDWVSKYGLKKEVSYGEANAVLYEAIEFLRGKQTTAGQTAEVALSIIWILESLKTNSKITRRDAFKLLDQKGLSGYLSDVTK